MVPTCFSTYKSVNDSGPDCVVRISVHGMSFEPMSTQNGRQTDACRRNESRQNESRRNESRQMRCRQSENMQILDKLSY